MRYDVLVRLFILRGKNQIHQDLGSQEGIEYLTKAHQGMAIEPALSCSALIGSVFLTGTSLCAVPYCSRTYEDDLALCLLVGVVSPLISYARVITFMSIFVP